ncbi:MAG: putative signal transducing protein [Bacteroidota bacterium]
MEFVLLLSYDNYVSAHIAMGRLEEDNIRCWLKDENTVTLDPILTNAVGGIKLMVEAGQAERAAGILRSLESVHKALHACPKCGSKNIEEVSTPRKASNWASAIIGLLFTNYAPKIDMVYHCFDCGHEYPVEEKITDISEV